MPRNNRGIRSCMYIYNEKDSIRGLLQYLGITKRGRSCTLQTYLQIIHTFFVYCMSKYWFLGYFTL